VTKKKSDDEQNDEAGAIDGIVEDSNLVALTGGYITTEVVTDEHADRIRSRIQEISKRLDDDRLELGALFYSVRSKAIYSKWVNPNTGKPFQTWEEYVDVETHFHVRNIHHMVAMWWWFSALQHFPKVRELIREVGWTKARVLVGLADDSNYEKWFAEARALARPDLERVARVALDKAGVPRRQGLSLQRPSEKSALPPPPSAAEVGGLAQGQGQPAGEDDDVHDGVDTDPVKSAQAKGVDVAPVNTTPVATGTTASHPTGDQEPRQGIAVPTEEERATTKVRWTAEVDLEQERHIEAAVAATYDVLKETMDLTKRPAKSEVGRGLALEMMATHFLSFYSGAAATVKDLRNRIYFRDIMKGLEKNFGVFVIAIDQKKGTIVHGVPDEALEAIEAKLGVDIVALKKGTNEVVFGWDTAQKIESLVSSEADEGQEDEGDDR
jgi:hypothetical protein